MNTPTIIYEDNTACVTQMQTGYVNSNMKKTHCSQVILSTWPSAKWRDKCHANKILWQPRRSFHKISTNHLIWKMCSRDWYETASRVARFRGEYLLKINSVHIALNSFLLWVFLIQSLYWDNVNMSLCLISCFPHRGFSGDIKGHKILLKLHEFMIEYPPFKSSFFFPQGFWKKINFIWSQDSDSIKEECYVWKRGDLTRVVKGPQPFPRWSKAPTFSHGVVGSRPRSPDRGESGRDYKLFENSM